MTKTEIVLKGVGIVNSWTPRISGYFVVIDNRDNSGPWNTFEAAISARDGDYDTARALHNKAGRVVVRTPRFQTNYY